MSVESLLDGAFTELLSKVPRAGQGQDVSRIVDVVFGFGTRGVPLDGTEVVFLRLGLNGAATVLSWSLGALTGGIPAPATCIVDVQAGETLASVASICGSGQPRLTAQVELNEQLPLGWSATLPDPVTVLAAVLIVDGVTEQLALSLRVAIGVDPLADVVIDTTGDVVVDQNGDVVT